MEIRERAFGRVIARKFTGTRIGMGYRVAAGASEREVAKEYEEFSLARAKTFASAIQA